jgi:dihydroorotase
MNKLCLKNGHVIDPANGIDKLADVWVANGKIAVIGKKPEGFDKFDEIDCKGLWVMPGLVDLAAHLREPGADHKAGIRSETKAAAASGITTLCCPPDTAPPVDTPAVAELIHHHGDEAGNAHVRVLGALTRALAGTDITAMAALKHAGCVGVSNARGPVENSMVMRRAMLYARTFDLTVFVEPEDHSLTGDGCVHEGRVSARLGIPGVPESAELVALSRDLTLARETGVRAHFGRLSCARSVELIARAKAERLPVTADVAAHQLFLTDLDCAGFDANTHVRPPFRTDEDRDGLRQGVADGVIDVVCSDHQPHDEESKLAPFPSASPGISALETLLPLSLRLVQEKLLDRTEMVRRLTSTPAAILSDAAGTLSEGATADICVVDPKRVWQLNPDEMVSRGHNTPFGGWEFTGRVVRTILAGKTVFEL